MSTRLHIAVALPLALLAGGCERTPKDRLQGRWLGESIENVPVANLSKATGWVKGTAIEFSGNRVTVTIPAETPRAGSFKVAKAEGDALTLSFQRSEGGHDEARFRFAKDGSLRWTLEGGPEIVLRKAKN